jgi:hypothetical protein
MSLITYAPSINYANYAVLTTVISNDLWNNIGTSLLYHNYDTANSIEFVNVANYINTNSLNILDSSNNLPTDWSYFYSIATLTVSTSQYYLELSVNNASSSFNQYTTLFTDSGDSIPVLDVDINSFDVLESSSKMLIISDNTNTTLESFSYMTSLKIN